MKSQAPTPQQWQALRRLAAAGCPLDISHLAPPDHPLRVIQAAELDTNVFPLPESIGIAFYVRMVAAVPLTIAQYRLAADWLARPVTWAEPCLEHGGKVCLATAVDRHLSFDKVLHRRTMWGGRLKAGQFIEGFFVGTSALPLGSSAEELPATLWIRDVMGGEFPYALTLKNRPELRRAPPG